MIPKILAYIIREASPEPEVLVFNRLEWPYELPEVPEGSILEGEDLAPAVIRAVVEKTGIPNAEIVEQIALAPYFAEWRGEFQVRNIFHLAAPPDLLDTWEYIVTGGSEDKGDIVTIFWLPVSVARKGLRWDQGQWLDLFCKKD